jgi:hypothetical protein
MMTSQDIYDRLDHLASDAHKVACSLEVGRERTEAFALYTVLHRLQRRGAAMHIHDATNPLMDYVTRPLADDVQAVLGLLDSNEWAEHCTKTPLGKRLESAITELVAKSHIQPITDHEIRETVNQLRDIAKTYGHTHQLREQIAYCIVDKLKGIPTSPPALVEAYKEAQARIAVLEARECHQGSKNALDNIVKYIEDPQRNEAYDRWREVSDRLNADGCNSLASHVIEFIDGLAQEVANAE